ncbi:ABC transporter domain-containing protein [Sarocladium implicatum]|nr:ABC transporter domain-containing protein [Sarocladium implicatum]
MSIKSFNSQTLALVRKNLILICRRSWLSTLIRGYILPIVFLVIIYHIPEFLKNDNKRFGTSDVKPMRSLQDVLGDQTLLLVAEGGDAAADVDRVFDSIAKPLDSSNIVRINNIGDLGDTMERYCRVDGNGNSPCLGAIVVEDSPLSKGGSQTWSYSIRSNPSNFNGNFDAREFDDITDTVFFPMQVAVENAITNSTGTPEAFKYTYMGTQKEVEEEDHDLWLGTVEGSILYFIFLTAATVVQHVSAVIARDRESGLSNLIDSMSGGAAGARTVSWIITFDIIYLPLWIILGCVHWALLFERTSLAIVLYWSVLGGFALVSGAVFGAAFFTRTQAASIAIFIGSVLLAVGGAIQGPVAAIPAVAACSALFPPMSWVFFYERMLTAEMKGNATDLLGIVEMEVCDLEYTFWCPDPTWMNTTKPIFLFIIFFIHIFAFAGLAIFTEKALHSKRHRQNDFDAASSEDDVAVQTKGLVKNYTPTWLSKIFFCCVKRRPSVKAVDGLDLVGYKNQVLCLLGPNGSGKTTTLDMLAGDLAPTSGAIQMKALPTKLGVCPQRNVLWNKLTVYEHLVIWNQLKGGNEDAASIERLIEKCDLKLKRDHLSKTLSGGMKRKLQLACMLIGGSSICLLDEVTTGLDPLSRRAIWNVILAERSHRTMILTTHFLDEAEVLGDNIVILSLGKTKCEGSPAQLKSQLGGSYHVRVPTTVDVSHLNYPTTIKDDQYVCEVPDSKTAVQVLSSLKNLGNSQSCVTGPTLEDVFLRVSEDSHVLASKAALEEQTTTETVGSEPLLGRMPLTRAKRFWVQFRALLIKRCIILRSHWWIYLFALALPIVCSHFAGNLMKKWKYPACGKPTATTPIVQEVSQWWANSGLTLGPESRNQTVADLLIAEDVWYFDPSYDDEAIYLKDSLDGVLDYVNKNRDAMYFGGIWAPKDGPPTIMYPADANAPTRGMALLNLANQAISGVNMTAAVGEFRVYESPQASNALFYIVVIGLLQAFYPSFFAIYPAYERKTQVRSLQYSNGIRPAPLLAAYLTFDFIFAIVVAAVVSALIVMAVPSYWGTGLLFLILALYGLASTMFVYLVSRITRSQPAAFALSFLLSAIMYGISVISVTAVNIGKNRENQGEVDGLVFGLGLIFPIENVLRGLEMGLNNNGARCRNGGFLTDPGAFFAYGGPILLLVIQIIALFMLTVYVEGVKLSWLSRKPKAAPVDDETIIINEKADVEAEKQRVVASEVDLLRLLNVSKHFGKNVAVEDVSFGLRSGEIMALLGPNGAGKTTTINMIRGDMVPSSGKIFLEGFDAITNTRHAQEYLGVCPQFDALDLLTVREHLMFYGRCKGVPELKSQVEKVMGLVGITAHASKMASALSGGNKRKLSLAIALLGNPPVLILDEPSSAMDAASKRVLWKTLEAVSPGRSVLITTHSMEEADALSTRAAIIAKRMLAIGTIRELRQAYSNEYHVQLALRSAPVSSQDEMESVVAWVRSTFGDKVQLDGQYLGGQIRFIVPIDNPVPASAPSGQSFGQYMIETLEANKETLALDCYSINTATMERVFLNVMKNTELDDDTQTKKRRWWHL